MSEQVLITTTDDNGVARLTMNRPELRNAFNQDIVNQICDTMGRLSCDPDVRIIVLTGA
ncbi:Enoyl-CoA hydratase, partial [hydrothermal vent metagenome]